MNKRLDNETIDILIADLDRVRQYVYRMEFSTLDEQSGAARGIEKAMSNLERQKVYQEVAI